MHLDVGFEGDARKFQRQRFVAMVEKQMVQVNSKVGREVKERGFLI